MLTREHGDALLQRLAEIWKQRNPQMWRDLVVANRAIARWRSAE